MKLRHILCLMASIVIVACGDGFKGSRSGRVGGQGQPPGPVVPPVMPPQPPVGGNISCSATPGRFHNAQEIVNYLASTGDLNTCVRLDGVTIRTGFGPCNDCFSDGYVPPNPPPPPPPPPPTPPQPPPPPPPGGPQPPPGGPQPPL